MLSTSMATLMNILIEDQNNRLLPSHTYSVLSRGDPAHTTSLSHQQLQDAHAKRITPAMPGFPPTATCRWNLIWSL
ncbi:hypothetical protein RRG08_008832 [Elysia crispata]|uniref:Uncharacterized protein n=1 Tax=Elysia crispata TaxID=231223 RepID=A0AAE0ZHA8_9GAST|nr:hypothetical protein RRG08_008832 [Elysia crispata]